jgi:UDP-N-acetylglucosamine 2-epimerase (non-hydrolysing)
LGFRAVTLRDSMERPEALESGSIGMCGVGINNFMEVINYFESAPLSKVLPESYFFEDTSERVVKFILSTVGQYKFWLGLR